MFMRLIFVGCAGFVVAASVARAEVESGPAPEAKVPALKAAMITGDSAGQEVDIAAEHKDLTTVYVLVQAEWWDRPLARFLKTLDTELTKNHSDVKLVAVWLTDDVEKSKEYLPRMQQSLKLERAALAVHIGGKTGPVEWTISDRAHLTVVIAQKGQAVARFGFISTNETEVPSVVSKLPEER